MTTPQNNDIEMTWLDYRNYFDEPLDNFLEKLFSDCETPWSPIGILEKSITGFFVGLKSKNNTIKATRKLLRRNDGSFLEGSYAILESELLTDDLVDVDFNIFIGAGTLLEAGATIKNNTIISSNCEIRQGAYLRGNTYIGSRSVVGHTTEIKNSIFMKHVEAGHFAYIGDTIIGSYVNLGAGTKISNLQFRSLEEKQRELFPEIPFFYQKQEIKTGLSKFGAIIGDGCETGCNSVICPFVFLEPECWVMPNYCVLKGVYKRGTKFK